MLKTNAGDIILSPKFSAKRHSGAIGKDVLYPKPITQYPGGKAELRYKVGTRGNGVDQPRWPEGSMIEIIAWTSQKSVHQSHTNENRATIPLRYTHETMHELVGQT